MGVGVYDGVVLVRIMVVGVGYFFGEYWMVVWEGEFFVFVEVILEVCFGGVMWIDDCVGGVVGLDVCIGWVMIGFVGNVFVCFGVLEVCMCGIVEVVGDVLMVLLVFGGVDESCFGDGWWSDDGVIGGDGVGDE